DFPVTGVQSCALPIYRRAMNRRGFTIIELMVAIAIFAIVLGAGLQLLGAQSRGMARGADRVGATQNLQYAASILTRDLRTIGTRSEERRGGEEGGRTW